MINRERLLNNLLELVRIPSPSGHEEQVAVWMHERLSKLGLDVTRDAAGNLLARLDGQGESLMLTAHMDTVPCETVVPVVRDGSVYSDGSSILGGDDKCGLVAILEALTVLQEDGLAHRPVEVLCTVEEEVGLRGAKAFDCGQLSSRMGIGLDSGGEPGAIVVSAPSQDSLYAHVHGRAAHAGASPELGINAIVVAAEAITKMPMGRIDQETTANIGVISGGSVTNIVPDSVIIRGEARSRDATKLASQSEAMVSALEHAADTHGATIEVKVTRTYHGYTFSEDDPVVLLASRATRVAGVEPYLVPSGGGSDANIFNAAGVPTVQIAAAMRDVHTNNEHVVLDDLVTVAKIVLASLRT